MYGTCLYASVCSIFSWYKFTSILSRMSFSHFLQYSLSILFAYFNKLTATPFSTSVKWIEIAIADYIIRSRFLYDSCLGLRPGELSSVIIVHH